MIKRLDNPFVILSFVLTVIFYLLSAKPIKQLTIIQYILVFFGTIKWLELCLEKKQQHAHQQPDVINPS